MKVRYAKFGVKWGNLHLYVAETVWRFNHRYDDICAIINVS